MTKKPVDRERLKERWLSTQELSGGPYRLGAINRHRQFSLLHAAAKARGIGNIEVAHLALGHRGERAPRRLISTAWLSANPARIVGATDWPHPARLLRPHPRRSRWLMLRSTPDVRLGRGLRLIKAFIELPQTRRGHDRPWCRDF